INTKVLNHRSESYRRFSSTSHWQNGRLSAKLKVSAFYSAECVPHSLFICKLALWKHIGYVLAKLNFLSNLSATSPMRFPLVATKTNDN
ncbi:hypothetical protein, partial [Myroides odoratimimus]|uniref:hypothetical protein n=1 Tax=Myroides odoratimimus TaxID=76832 RepID=UPI002574BE04